MKRVKWVFPVILLFSIFSAFAQTDSVVLRAETFEIHSKSSAISMEDYKEMNRYFGRATRDITLDSYRFYEQKRIIDFVNSDVYIVLYSAKELNENKGIPVSPEIIRQGQAFHKVAFEADPNGSALKPKFLD